MNPEWFVNQKKGFALIQTVRNHTCLPQAGTSDNRLKLKIKKQNPTEKGTRTLQGLIPCLK
jgi:hypothetical protein